MMGINQQKNVIIKQRLTSSVSIFFISPYLTIKMRPREAIPMTTKDQPKINHLKKSDTETSILNDQKANCQLSILDLRFFVVH